MSTVVRKFQKSSLLGGILVIVVSLLTLKGYDAWAAPAAQDISSGQAIYIERCSACHGINGDGQGPAAERLFVKPRDFTRDEYKIKSTEGDEFPSRDDLIRTIAEGMPGTSMPAWKDELSQAEIGEVADYIQQSFGRFFSQEGYGTTPIDVPGRISPSEESIERGRVLYHEEIECFKCHGLAGRGDGPSAFELTDNAGNVIYPADLSQPWFYRGGSEPEDLYLRLQTGLTGSPMPSFADALSEDDTWHLVNYILSLAPKEAPEPAVLLVSERVEGALPANPDDAAWDQLEAAYYPLTGYIMKAPRYYQPFINSITAKSFYNDSEIAFLVAWSDRTETREGEAVDALAVQFPQELSNGNERPYFVFGDSDRAVYQWYWSADADDVIERNAKGLDAISEQPEERQNTSAITQFQDGQWQVLFRRPLQTGDAEDTSFTSDQFIPIAFVVWDGFANESGSQMGLTTWSQLHLPAPTSLMDFGLIPVVIIAVVAAEGLVLWRVRRTSRRDGVD